MSGHTPGPWQAERRESERYDWKYGIHISAAEIPNRPIANVLFSTGDADVGLANANLIAAAPLLLDALETLLGVGGHYDACFGGAPYHRRCEPICAKARAAVQAARGVEGA